MSSLRPQRSSSPRFMPFPGLSAQRGSSLLQQNQGGYARSPSGSETDSVSTSTENLSHEERYAIRHTPRQEPQGQENISSGVLGSHCSSVGGSTTHSLPSSCHRVSTIRDLEDQNLVSYHHNKSGSSSYHPSKNSSVHCGVGGDGAQEKKMVGGCGSGGREITEIPVDYLDQSQVLKHLAKEVTKIKSGRKSLDLSLSSSPSSSGSSSLSSNASSPVALYPSSQKTLGQGEGDSPRDVQQRRVGSPSSCGTMVSGGGGWVKGRRGSSSSEAAIPFRGRLHLSRSQPDLSRLGSAASRAARDAAALKGSATNPRPRTKARDMLEWRLGLATCSSSSGRQAASGMVEQVVWPQLEMVEILVQENSALKLELEACFQKVAKSQKLEQEVSKVHRSHQELIESSERRERLERAARLRLQGDIRRLQELNHSLSAQLSLMVVGNGQGGGGNDQSSSSNSSLEVSALRKELAERELFLAQLVTSNKELAACKERQEIELAAQRATLQEQRTHIDILDTALTNAQGNVVRLEEECRKKQMYVERVGQLQRALSSLQLASDRREQTERKLRTQLEREIRELRDRDVGNDSNKMGDAGMGGGGDCRNDMDKKGSDGSNLEEEVRELRRQLREREERILAVEAELAQWERRCIQEGALRQAAIDAASIPKDAKIAALERTSQESERLVAEARSEKMRHMDEVHAAQRKVADLEARLKDLESRLAERDAMIRVLQKHTYEKESAVAFLSSPHHTPHTSGLHSSSFHSGLHSSSLHGNGLHGNSSLHSNGLHGNSYHGSSLHTSGLHGSSYHDSSVYRVAAAEILATTREELGSVSTASVFSTVNSSSGIGGSCDSSSGGNVGNLGSICSPGAGSGIGGTSSGLRSVQYGSPPLNNSAGTTSVVGGDTFGGGSVGGGSGVGSSSREVAASSSIITSTSNCSFDDAKKSLDDQLKELDSQLLSKRALCCFPGLSNPGSQARKGAVPKPLLAGVAAPSRSLPPHLLFTAAGGNGGGTTGADDERNRKGAVGDKGRDGMDEGVPGRNTESGRIGARRSGRSRGFVPGSVLEGMARYGAVSNNSGGNNGGAGVGGGNGVRSGSPSMVGFVPDILKGGGAGRYGMGGTDGRREGDSRGGEGGGSSGGGTGGASEEIRLLEKQGMSSQRMRKGEGGLEEDETMGERGDGRKKGRKTSGSGGSSSSCQKGGGSSDGGGGGGEAGSSSSVSLVSHLPPRTGIPIPSPRRTRKTEGVGHQGGGGHRRRMVGGGGAVVGVGSSSRGYGRLNEEDAVSKSGEGEMECSVESDHGRRRSSSTSSVAGMSASGGKIHHHLQQVVVSQPMSVLSSPPPRCSPQLRSSQVVSKIRLFQGNGGSTGGGTASRTGLPIGGKTSSNASSPLLRERLGGGKYRIQL